MNIVDTFDIDTRRDSNLVKLTQHLRKLDPNNYQVVIIEKEPVRSQQLNALYWVLIEKISEYTGHTKLEIHKFMAYMFNIRVKETGQGSVLLFPGSTAKMRQRYFVRYLEHVRFWAQEFLGMHLNLGNMSQEDIIEAAIYG